MSESIDRVREAARRGGLDIEVVEFEAATKTATQAAEALGCDVARIVKSLVFTADHEPVVALVPGDRRVDTAKLAASAEAIEIERASLDLVRSATGFVAGGTPPFGHVNDIRVFADSSLRRHDTVWAAAGTPHTVFEIAVDDLARLTDPVWAEISED